MVGEGKKEIASFLKHPAYSNFKMYSVLILFYFLFWFPAIYLECFCKSHFFLKFRCSTKAAKLLHLSWSTLYRVISKCIVCWFHFFKFWLPTIHPKCFYSDIALSSDIASFVEHPVYSTLKIYSALILVLFILFCHVWMCKILFSGNSRCSAKGAVILLLSWSILYVAFSKCIVSWF